MTDPTTTPTPPQLTDKQLLELAAGEIEADDVLPMDEHEAPSDWVLDVYRSELIASMRAAIAADRANRPAPSVGELVDVATDLHRVASDLSDKDLADSAHTCRQAATLLEQFRLGGWIVPTVEQVTPAADRANHLRDATKMALTPEEVEARFRAWWAESFPNAPAGPHAVRSHVAFALHLMGGEVAA